MLNEFREQYIKKCINGDGFDEELDELFNQVLSSEFDDDPERMSNFIQEIIDEHTPKEPTEVDLLKKENQELKQQMQMTQGAIMDLADMILSQ